MVHVMVTFFFGGRERPRFTEPVKVGARVGEHVVARIGADPIDRHKRGSAGGGSRWCRSSTRSESSRPLVGRLDDGAVGGASGQRHAGSEGRCRERE